MRSQRNTEMEFQRNRERYEFLKWGQKAFSNFRVVPPMTGIVHQVNLEYLADVVMTKQDGGETLAFPDTLVGTDSHTTMINGLGVVGWGVGGIEAEAVMLGQPMDMLLPDVIGFKLHGKLRDGVTATDLVLTVTQMLRKKGVVDKFVEFFGDGLEQHVADRPRHDRQHGSRIWRDHGLLPGGCGDAALHAPDRPPRGSDRSARKPTCAPRDSSASRTRPTLNSPTRSNWTLASVVPSLAGPKRPQDRVPLSDMKRRSRRR